MTLTLHLLFILSALVYVLGGWLDYHNSLGRGEQTEQFQDERGYFDKDKFRFVQIRDFIVIAVGSLVFEFLLSRVTEDYAYGLLIGIASFGFIGVRGLIYSRR